MWWELRMGGSWPGITCDRGGRAGQVRAATRMYSRGEDPRPRTRVGEWGCRTAHSMLRCSETAGSRVAVSQGQVADQVKGHSWGPGRCL